MDPVDLAIRRYDAILRYLAYENTVYWTRGSFLLAANAGLFAFVASKLPFSAEEVRGGLAIAIAIACIGGLALSTLWQRALTAGEFWISRWEGICRSLEAEAFGDIKVWRNCRANGDRAKSVAHRTAMIFSILWSAALFYMISMSIVHYRSVDHASSAASTEISTKPLMLEKNEGELRTWRPRTDNKAVAAPQFRLKVSPKNNGSQHLVLGTEELGPGAAIVKHRHLGQDEILLIQSGTAHVWLGNQERDVHAGGLVFIPTHTWASVKNTGSEPVGLTFIFSEPGFEDMMRCNSVAAGEPMTPITPKQRAECVHKGHAEYEDLPECPRVRVRCE